MLSILALKYIQPTERMMVSLISDYGYQDHYVGIAKALLYTQLSGITLIDISHDVTPHHLLQCAYLLSASMHAFPDDTVHLCLFGMMYTLPARVLIAKHKGQYIISADNGLLPLILKSDEKIYAMPKVPDGFKEWINNACDLIKDINAQNLDWEKLIAYKPEIYAIPPKPVLKENSVECNVVHVDRFGNVVLNINKEEFEQYRAGRRFQIVLRRNEYIDTIHQHYADVVMDEKLCLFNEAGYLEIAMNQSSAANLLGLRLYDPRLSVYQHIKIEFL